MKTNPTTLDLVKQKLTLIEDIFRVTKLSIVMDASNEIKVTTGSDSYFDALMQQSNADLEIALAEMSAQLNHYMKAHHRTQIKDLRIITSDFRYPDNIFSKISYN